jgi:hypothetical protein
MWTETLQVPVVTGDVAKPRPAWMASSSWDANPDIGMAAEPDPEPAAAEDLRLGETWEPAATVRVTVAPGADRLPTP